MHFTPQDRTLLHQTAQSSISHGLRYRRPLPVTLDDLSESLMVQRSCFVTLKLAGELRGCIGSIEANRPLIEDVSENAFAAAFHDQRFDPLTAEEYENIGISLSILTEAVHLHVASTRELADKLRPYVDGVILESEDRRGVFLPQVWQALPDPEAFIQQLKRKAGIPDNLQPPALRVSLFEVETV